MSEKQSGNPTPGGSSAAPAPGLSPTNASKPVVPDYELIKRIGRGSYGEVWLGRTATGSCHAVKVVYRATFEADKPYEREFTGIKEFEPISRSHPAQIDILHVGRNDQAGYFYYVMELADDESAESEVKDLESLARQAMTQRQQKGSRGSTAGSTVRRTIHPETYAPRTLRSVLRERGRLPVEECLQIAPALAEALEHLHSHGLVHRDIKPSNVIFVNGRPKLADIGLVARADATLSFVGTEGYLPPEGPGKPQADLYSLGKVLYEMATGKDRNEFPEAPSIADSGSDHSLFLELNEIILRACESSLANRYRSASELLADLELLETGKSVRRKYALRGTVAVALKALMSVVGLTVIGILAYKAFWSPPVASSPFSAPGLINVGFDPADLHPSEAYQLPQRFAFSDDYKQVVFVRDGRLFLGHLETLDTQPLFESQSAEWSFSLPTWGPDETIAVAAFRRDQPIPENPEERQTAFFVGDVIKDTRLRPVYEHAPGTAQALAWAPDGKRLTAHAVWPPVQYDISLAGELTLWPGTELPGRPEGAWSYSPNKRWLAATIKGDIWLLKPGGQSPVRVTHHRYPEFHPAWADDATLIYVTCESGRLGQGASLMLQPIDPDTGSPVGSPDPLPLHSFPWSQILYPKVVNGGQTLVFLEHKSIPILKSADYPKASTIHHIGPGASPLLSPDGSKIYYLDFKRGFEGIYVRPSTGGEAHQIVAQVGIAGLGFFGGGYDLSPDGDTLAYAWVEEGWRLRMAIVPAAGGEPPRTIYEQQLSVSSSASSTELGNPMPRWSPDGQTIALIVEDDKLFKLLLIDPKSGRVRTETNVPGGSGPHYWSPDGEHIAVIVNEDVEANRNREAYEEQFGVYLYSQDEGSWRRLTPPDEMGLIEFLSWHPDGNQITYMRYGPPERLSETRSVSLDREGSQLLFHLADHWEYVGVWAPDGQRYYFISSSKLEAKTNPERIHIFHANNGVIDHDSPIGELPVWSRDGSTMAWVETQTPTDQFWEMELK